MAVVAPLPGARLYLSPYVLVHSDIRSPATVHCLQYVPRAHYEGHASIPSINKAATIGKGTRIRRSGVRKLHSRNRYVTVYKSLAHPPHPPFLSRTTCSTLFQPPNFSSICNPPILRKGSQVSSSHLDRIYLLFFILFSDRRRHNVSSPGARIYTAT